MWRLPGRGRAASLPSRVLQPPPGAGRIVVLEEGHTPSGDYLLRPWLAQYGEVECLDPRNAPGPSALRPGDYVVVVRYLYPAWKKAIAALRDRLSGLAFFMDDDLLDEDAHRRLMRPYATKLKRLASTQRGWLADSGCALWVSTPLLAQKYAAWLPLTIPTAPPPRLLEQKPVVRLTYHGTASHQQEIDWLRPVVAAVQESNETTHFTLFGDFDVNRAYRDIPRVAILHPMRWEAYLAYTSTHPADIGLAPLLPDPFNAARGPIKFYDYARMNAFGLYSDCPPYAGWIRDGIDGLLLPLDAAVWTSTLLELAQDPTRRDRLRAGVRERVRAGTAPQ